MSDENFNKWLEQWDKAQLTENFKSAPKPVSKKTPDFFGIGETKPRQEKFSLNEVDTKYWNKVYKLSRHQGEDPDIFQELKGIENIKDDPLESDTDEDEDEGERDTPDRDQTADQTKKMASAANPQTRSIIGKDQRPVVSPERSDGKRLRKINDKKIDRIEDSLEKLQCKLAAHPKFGAYGKEDPKITELQKKIDALNDELDDLSNSTSPDFIGDEES